MTKVNFLQRKSVDLAVVVNVNLVIFFYNRDFWQYLDNDKISMFILLEMLSENYILVSGVRVHDPITAICALYHTTNNYCYLQSSRKHWRSNLFSARLSQIFAALVKRKTDLNLDNCHHKKDTTKCSVQYIRVSYYSILHIFT